MMERDCNCWCNFVLDSRFENCSKNFGVRFRMSRTEQRTLEVYVILSGISLLLEVYISLIFLRVPCYLKTLFASFCQDFGSQT